MSLEQALDANTAALQGYTSALEKMAEAFYALRSHTAVYVDDQAAAANTSMPQTSAFHAEDEAVASKATAMAAQQAAETKSPPDPGQAAPDKDALSSAVTAAVTRNREGVLALLARYKVKRATEVPHDKWGQLTSEMEAL